MSKTKYDTPAPKLPFEEQINFFKNKLNLPTDSYLDLEGQEHDYAFVVAGANRNDILTDFRTAVDKAINDGTTLEAFRKSFDEIVSERGWNYNGGRDWRSRIIYDTNLYSSFAAGRHEQHGRMKALRPYWEYKHRDGVKHPRPLHKDWDGLVLHCDDPFWQTHYPINGYGCHCSVIAHSAKSLQREELKISKSPKINYVTKELGKRSGNPKTVTLPEGIDYGFDRIAGSNRVDMPSKLLLDKAVSVPPKLATNMVSNVLQVAEVRALLNNEVKEMVDLVEKEKIARGVSKSVGVLPEPVVDALVAENLTPSSAVITLRDHDVLHALRDNKDAPLPLSFWENIADYLIEPEAVLLDTLKADNALLYIINLGTDKGKVIVRLDYELKVKDEDGKRQRIITNIIRSGKQIVYNQKMRDGLSQHKVLFGAITP
ncbi:phage head morphogenesis protein [Psychrobacter sp. I-STPA10]|uniref:phage head morphogenesis protein n=1 Tax=Psychrobacter sp. I-STPA10 TaxID=2585769 RepID=UPI001E649A42|nr:phage minor head protein [Psychrobacter sp. I-STPA10]